MSKGKFDIKTILDIPRWEAVQDQLAKATGTAIITIDYKGTPITKHSMRTDFCNIIRENPISRKRCQKCDSLAGLEAVRLNQPFIYLCHCGIVDVAVPITVGDQYLGAVMFGQVRISNGSDAGVEPCQRDKLIPHRQCGERPAARSARAVPASAGDGV
ncbi:MAG: PocR ligand-binding domain-containing protein [Oscillospiraceae bacterium]